MCEEEHNAGAAGYYCLRGIGAKIRFYRSFADPVYQIHAMEQ